MGPGEDREGDESMNARDEIAEINQKHWEKQVEEGCGFTRPWLDLDRDLIRRYIDGKLDPVSDPLIGMYPAGILANVEGKDVLCLASGGGQQSAVFGLLGARVTVVDIAEGQLEGDRIAAEHYGYEVTIIHADMRDLSCLADGSFGLVYHEASMSYVPDVRQVYSEVARVLRTGGLYRVHFTNPAAEFAHEEWDGKGYRVTRPYAERSHHLPGGPIEFRHYLSDIFNGLVELRLSIQGVEEDPHYRQQDAQAPPGSWEHSLIYLVGFAVVARKD